MILLQIPIWALEESLPPVVSRLDSLVEYHQAIPEVLAFVTLAEGQLQLEDREFWTLGHRPTTLEVRVRQRPELWQLRADDKRDL